MSTPEDNLDPAAELSGEQDGGEIEQLRAALAAAEAKANEGRDQALRAMAELENVRRRAARDIEQAHRYALEKFANELVGVKDSLEMGLAVQNATADDLRAGSDATLKLLAKAFERAGVIELVPEGQPFNPEFHEAMAMAPSAEQPPNTVLTVVQKGYQLNGRLLRPARVLVSRTPD